MVNSLVGAAFGACGQRCMALSVAVMVGDSQKWIPDIQKQANKLTVGPGNQNPDIGPMISKEQMEKVKGIV